MELRTQIENKIPISLTTEQLHHNKGAEICKKEQNSLSYRGHQLHKTVAEAKSSIKTDGAKICKEEQI